MTSDELAWVAGLLEGEGCFSIKQRSISISCNMTDEDTIAQLHELTEHGRMRGPTTRPNRKPIWGWDMSRRVDVVNLLVALRPYMGIRRTARIDEMLDWNEANPLGRQRKDAAQHGSLGMYTNHGCRCGECVEAMSAYERQRYASDPERFRAYNRKSYWKDPVRSRRLARERTARSRASAGEDAA